MKKVFITALAVMMAAMIACKNEEPGASSLPLDEGPIKYARVTVSAYKEEGLKSWGANISKTEPVVLLETVKVQIKGSETEVAKVKLSDGNVLFVNNKYLADQPVVFVEDTRAYVRNNESSRVYALIPKGTIGFILKEMDEWVQIYAGQIEGKWVTQQWVNGGYTTDEGKIREAKNFEEAVAVLSSSSSKQDRVAQSLAILKDIASSSGMFADMANEFLDNYAADDDKSSDENADESGSDDFSETAKVEAGKGLTMRAEPGVSSKAIVVIPNGSDVKIIKKGDKEETIGDKTSPWFQVEWNGKKGWVFGGFLSL
jgi:uncharacterized protein YgiM (DUF1202 family)